MKATLKYVCLNALSLSISIYLHGIVDVNLFEFFKNILRLLTDTASGND